MASMRLVFPAAFAPDELRPGSERRLERQIGAESGDRESLEQGTAGRREGPAASRCFPRRSSGPA
jgi:hypothetical protein